VHDYEVTGTLAPDATGYYDRGPDYAGYPYYEHAAGTFCIWWFPRSSQWTLSTKPPNRSPGYWYRNAQITGDYMAAGTYTGTPTVIAP